MDHVTAAGVDVPALGIGTAPMEGEQCRRAVETALDAGYRHVDTAQMYENEAAVGRAIRDSPVPRDEVFLVTKVDRPNLAYDDLLDSVDASLYRLGVDTVDCLLIHAPSRSVPVEESLRAMAHLRDEGFVDHLGVSNFSVPQLREALDAVDAPILTNQVEYNPFVSRDDLLAVCAEEEVVLTAYTPLAKGRVAADETLREIGERHGKTPAQVALRWLLQQEVVAAIPKAADPDHVRENAAVFDFELTDAEMERVFELRGGLGERVRRLLGL